MIGLTPEQLNYSQAAQWSTLIKQELADARCAAPAFLVEDLDPATNTVTVQIAIQERVRTKAGAVWTTLPIIPLVPLVLPRGGGYSLTLPLKKGNEGLLLFCDACIDHWYTSGGIQKQNEVRRHFIHDCGFIPGMTSQPNVLPNYSTTSAQLRSDDGATVVDLGPGGLRLQAPHVTADHGGVALPLVNDNFYQWFVTVFMPSVQYNTVAPPLPIGPETAILKGE